MIDLGATNNFISPGFQEEQGIGTQALPYTIPVSGLDREVLSGGVTDETIALKMIIDGHPE